MVKPSFDATLKNIQLAFAESVARIGKPPNRIYMNHRTRLALNGVFQRAPLVMVPEGTQRVITIYGAKILICDDLDDCEVDAGLT